MRKIIFQLIVLIIFQTSFSSAENSPLNIGQKFIAGLPEPMNFNWPEAFYAEINAGEFYDKICIVYESELNYPEHAALVLVLKTGGFSMTSIEFQISSDNSIYATSKIIKTKNEDELELLNIQISKNAKLFHYYWGENKGHKVPNIKKEYLLKVGKVFPNIEIENTNRKIDLGKSDNKIRVINWWATSCLPCVEEMPGLNNLVKKYKNKDIEFISIIWDEENLDKFLKQHKFLYEHFKANSTVTELFGQSFPRNLVIDKHRIIKYNQCGGTKDKYKEIEQIIKEIIKNDI